MRPLHYISRSRPLREREHRARNEARVAAKHGLSFPPLPPSLLHLVNACWIRPVSRSLTATGACCCCTLTDLQLSPITSARVPFLSGQRCGTVPQPRRNGDPTLIISSTPRSPWAGRTRSLLHSIRPRGPTSNSSRPSTRTMISYNVPTPLTAILMITDLPLPTSL